MISATEGLKSCLAVPSIEGIVRRKSFLLQLGDSGDGNALDLYCSSRFPVLAIFT